MPEETRKCYWCHDSTVDTRPYGPAAAEVCFACAIATPERKAQVEAAFAVQLAAAQAAGRGVATATASGPQPGIQEPE